MVVVTFCAFDAFIFVKRNIHISLISISINSSISDFTYAIYTCMVDDFAHYNKLKKSKQMDNLLIIRGPVLLSLLGRLNESLMSDILGVDSLPLARYKHTQKEQILSHFVFKNIFFCCCFVFGFIFEDG